MLSGLALGLFPLSARAQTKVSTPASGKTITEQCKRGGIYRIVQLPPSSGGGQRLVALRLPPSGIDPEKLPPGTVQYQTSVGGKLRTIQCGSETARKYFESLTYAGKIFTPNPSSAPATIPSVGTVNGSDQLNDAFTTTVPQTNRPFTPAQENSAISDTLGNKISVGSAQYLNDLKLQATDLTPGQANEMIAATKGEAQANVAQSVADVTGFQVKSENGLLIQETKGLQIIRDPLDGTLIMTQGPDAKPVLYTAQGIPVPTCNNNCNGWTDTLPRLSTPEAMDRFMKAYTGTDEPLYTATPEVLGRARLPGNFGDFPTSNVVVRDAAGNSILVTPEVFRAVQTQENQVYGTTETAQRLQDMTAGKLTLSITGLPTDRISSGAQSEPTWGMAVLSGPNRAAVALQVESSLFKYPPEYWQASNPIKLYTDAKVTGTFDFIGYAQPTLGSAGLTPPMRPDVWVDGNLPIGGAYGLQATLDHELAHQNQNRILPQGSNAFAREAQGDSYASQYVGRGAVMNYAAGKVGFANAYGSVNIPEDIATMSATLFINPQAAFDIAKTDVVFRKKIDLLIQGYSNMTGGVMNLSYFQNIVPIAPGYSPR